MAIKTGRIWQLATQALPATARASKLSGDAASVSDRASTSPRFQGSASKYSRPRRGRPRANRRTRQLPQLEPPSGLMASARAKLGSRLAFAIVLAATLLAATMGLVSSRSTRPPPPEEFAAEIAAFEAADARSMPSPGGILFVGSSSIRRWKTLERDMAPLRVLNRGFGGSELEHVLHFFDRVVTPYRPRAIVLYEGDNDLGDPTHKTPTSFVGEFVEFSQRVWANSPDTKILFISIKPTPERWRRWPILRATNAEIAALCRADHRLHYIDVASSMLRGDGSLRPEIFLDDDLHLNALGYADWATIVRGVLLEVVGETHDG